MGRSVINHPNATTVAYDYLEWNHAWFHCDECDEWVYRDECEHVAADTFIPCTLECDHSGEWRDYVDYVQESVTRMFPSMQACDDYYHSSEQRILARNAHSEVSISEYCDSVSISLAAYFDRDTYWRDDSALGSLGEQWRRSVSERFQREFGTLAKVGTFSNGESVYVTLSPHSEVA